MKIGPASVYTISDWSIKDWMQTIGTRDKFFVEDPETNKQYYFKESISKYPSEFWSEIIASKLGQHLGFNMLDYNVGIHNETLGCLCESMIDQKHQELEHGIGLIKRSNANFHITERPEIYFKDVIKSLKTNDFIYKFLQIMVFDALIGNQDRHSENWAVIRTLHGQNISKHNNWGVKWWYNQYQKSGLKLNQLPFKNLFLNLLHKENMLNISFAPIYDSGSSLGRELAESKIESYLKNEAKIIKYIDNGVSEIRWESDKINHFELLQLIMKEYNSEIKEILKEVQKKFNEENVKQLIYNIDSELTKQYGESGLSLQRKAWIFELIKNRYKKLINIDFNG